MRMKHKLKRVSVSDLHLNQLSCKLCGDVLEGIGGRVYNVVKIFGRFHAWFVSLLLINNCLEMDDENLDQFQVIEPKASGGTR